MMVFDGKNYSSWKKRILKFLEAKSCKEVATRVKDEKNDKEPEWGSNNVKAVNYIYCAISDKQLEYIGDKESAYEIMIEFDKMYLKESTALQIVCRSNLESIKLKNYSDVTTFFDEFEKAVNQGHRTRKIRIHVEVTTTVV